ncbi:MAG: adenosine deaminase, partial [Chromatiales bacterium]|nr:adenosine deaminase [Chromatiales bacterium]
LIPSIDREASPQAATELVAFMIDNRDDRVLGLGIDYRENDGPPELFTDAYAMAREAGFKTTAHAGEFGMPWPNVLTALDTLGVDRLDHAYTMLDNPELVQRCVDSGTIVTVVPSNSYYLSTLAPEEWADQHPIRRMGAAGLRIHPNSDDPAFHLINPTQAWESMIADFGYTPSDLRSFMLNGIDGAWIEDDKRREWTNSWSEEFHSLLANEPAGMNI